MTNFKTEEGIYRFKRLIYGINTAGDVFQRCLQSKISDLKGVKCISDDIIIYGRTETEHKQNLENLFERLEKHGFKVNAPKCLIGKTSIEFFGVNITDKGVKPDPEKISSLKEAKAPTTKPELQSFLGLCTFMSRFIPNFGDKTAQLRELIKNDVPFRWTNEHEKAFEKLKNELIGDDIVSFHNPNKTCVVWVDASDFALGGILLQENDQGQLKPIVYVSRSLTDCERKYSLTEKVALGLMWSIEKLH